MRVTVALALALRDVYDSFTRLGPHSIGSGIVKWQNRLASLSSVMLSFQLWLVQNLFVVYNAT